MNIVFLQKLEESDNETCTDKDQVQYHEPCTFNSYDTDASATTASECSQDELMPDDELMKGSADEADEGEHSDDVSKEQSRNDIKYENYAILFTW